ncbi:TetR/AcrR family transcriptional regulator [Actinomadura barringtoniae]|uniref:TetR/AcrR family transcriptional regulator n=1 Tax=Actinomadura barringtoniae TaxID=1427535 RepID=A0A939PL41_9ACTN|nr:TetR/AcrR family transcriptional regulator [Actinomadura barringtoniae]MBO2452058.1 TetR/AcrR family transcriptional regulator [Actinomadura barringtoniae]
MSAGRTARERVRAELIREMTEIARKQLATEGATGLSLRAVAREMGMVSSAIYRYFPSRDDLLTALIIDGYNAVGEAVERAVEACPAGDHLGRWLAVCRAVREWALAHPHEYALIYGSPVPGYQAPEETVPAALRDTIVLARVVSDAEAAGALEPVEDLPPLPSSLVADVDRARVAVAMTASDDVAARALVAWAGLYGTVSFELFGQFENVIGNRDDYFDFGMRSLGRLIGFKS